MNSTGRRLRIGVFTKPLDDWNSGSGHHLDEIVRHLVDLNDAEGLGLDLTLIHYAPSENPIYARARELIVPRNPLRAAHAVDREGFDLVHYSPLTVYSPIVGVRARKTATVHGAEEALFPEGYSLVQRIHEAVAMPILMRRMDGVATVSETSKRLFVSRYRVRPERVFITPNGLSPSYRVLPRESLRCPIGGVDRPFILHISKYSTRKNPAGIIGGFARFVAKTGSDYLLVCAGRGWDGPGPRSVAEAEGVSSRYVAPGFVSEADAATLLNLARAFVFPSFAEGFGMPNLEAMASACPVVTSPTGAIPEIVADAALLAEAGDADAIGEALARAVADSGEKKALVERGLARASLFDWDESARALARSWRDICEKGR